MFKLTFELMLCVAVVVLASLYVRERYRNIRSRLLEWLRIQRITAAAAFVGPGAVAVAPRKAARSKDVREDPALQTTTNPIVEAAAPVTPIEPTDFKAFDVPTYMRNLQKQARKPLTTTLAMPANDATFAQVSVNQPVGDEELVVYP